jgi:hypothetical protein
MLMLKLTTKESHKIKILTREDQRDLRLHLVQRDLVSLHKRSESCKNSNNPKMIKIILGLSQMQKLMMMFIHQPSNHN